MEKQKMIIISAIERIIQNTKGEDNYIELIDELQVYLADLKRDNNDK